MARGYGRLCWYIRRGLRKTERSATQLFHTECTETDPLTDVHAKRVIEEKEKAELKTL